MRQVTEKQLVVESLARALKRYDQYYAVQRDTRIDTSIDWTDDKSVFAPYRQKKRY